MKTSMLSVAWLLGALAALASGGTVGTKQVPPDQRIITLRAGANALKVARRHGIIMGNVYSVALKGFAGRVPASSMASLAADPDVVRVESDLVLQAVAQTLPTGVSRIGAPNNPYAQINGKDERVNVDVAVIDTGIDLKHPELNVAVNKSFVTGETSGQDQNGHGSHVSGIIGAIDNTAGVVGVAPGVRLWALKVLDKNGSGYLSDIIKAIDYAAANSDKIAVVNMSLGGQGRNDSMRQAIQNCVARGVVVVVAAGNDSKDIYGTDKVMGTSDDFIPAAYPEVCCVSALGDTDGKAGGLGSATSYGTPDDTFASFTNYSRYVAANPPVKSPGAAIDLAAPGVDIRSTVINSSYATYSGTSMSSPHVAGAVALYIAEHGRATNAAGVYAIRQALVNAAQPQSQWGPASTGDPDTNREGCVYVGTSTTPTNTAPTVTISQPKSGSSANAGTAISFTSTASDKEDGTLTASLKWTSSLDGPIGTGGSFSKALSVGTHTVTASVTDKGGLTGSASVTVTVKSSGNTPPAVTISKPADGATFDSNTAIAFKGSASDTQDGNLTSSLKWISNFDGQIGTGGSFSKTLSPGTHTITASVTDKGGLKGSASVSVTVEPYSQNTPPSVAITQPTDGATFDSGTAIAFTGSAADTQDGDLTAGLTWTSDLDGPIGNGGSFSAVLRDGTHTITASVTDSGGLTATATITVTVQSSGGGSSQLYVTATTDKPVYGWWEFPIFTVRVTDGAAPVAGAVVSLSLLTPTGRWLSAVGVADASGTFRVAYRPNPRYDGLGSFWLLVSASMPGYTNGSGMTSFILWY